MARFAAGLLLSTATGFVGASSIFPRADPAPLSLQPNSQFLGDDGSWTTFQFTLGSGSALVNLVASTASSDIVIIQQGGCPSTLQSCDRGSDFSLTESKTWQNVSNKEYTVEQDLGITAPTVQGTDSFDIKLANGNTQTLSTQNISVVNDPALWIGSIGLQPSSGDDNSGMLSYLKSNGVIPSLAYGYTAGAKYRTGSPLGSLVLGGYDESRYFDNGLQFSLGTGSRSDLSLEIQSIQTEISGSAEDLLPSKIEVVIDTSVSDIWLPIEACKEFEKAFGITWNSTAQLYTMSDSQTSNLSSSNPNVTFSISGVDGSETLDLVLPYNAFNLEAAWLRYEYFPQSIPYFPLRRANSSDQYTLGRAFFQEVYLTANYDNSTFSLVQCRFSSDAPNIVPIGLASTSSGPAPSSTTTAPPSSGSSVNGAVIGPAVAVPVVVILAAIVGWLLYRRKKKQQPQQPKASAGDPNATSKADQEWRDNSGPASRPDMQGPPGPAFIPGRRVDELNTGIEHERFEVAAETPGSGPMGDRFYTPTSERSPRPASPMSELSGDYEPRAELQSVGMQQRSELPAARRAELAGSAAGSPGFSPLPSGAGSPLPHVHNISPLQGAQQSPLHGASPTPTRLSPAGAAQPQRPPIERNPSSLTTL